MEQATDVLTRLAHNADETMNRVNTALSPENQALLADARAEFFFAEVIDAEDKTDPE